MLEGQIDDLYKTLVRLEASLRVIPSVDTPTLSSLDPAYSNASKLHLLSKQCMDKCCLVSQELLTLSLLLPGVCVVVVIIIIVLKIMFTRF